ncbi:SMC-Scp complex subunit ScpB [Candidatus Pacearchaeota archaeon]|nr:SMC-Scp complex subunit ScpB [Candidatus Pacearchaeota archaeon]
MPDNIISEKTIEEIDDAQELEQIKKIEAALFIAGRFLSLQELIMLTDVNPILLKRLLEKIEEKYESDEHAIQVVRKEEMWKMDVKPNYMEMVNKLATGTAEFSKAEQETLALIAYKSPMKQSIAIKIRGNKAYDHIKKFRELGLIKAKRTGNTNELTISDEFYNYFNIEEKKEAF